MRKTMWFTIHKLAISIAISILVFMAAPVWAYTVSLPGDLNYEVTNGDFQSGDFTGWTNDNFYLLETGGNYIPFNGSSPSLMYQVIDESQFNGWIHNGNEKDWWLTFDYRAGGSDYYGYAIAEASVYYYTSNPDTQPTFDPNNPGSGWEGLYASGTLPATSGFNTVEINGTVEGFQPRWIVLAFEGQYNPGTPVYAVSFDNIEFYGQCSNPVPLPPSVLLLGSGFLGFGFLGMRLKNRG